MMRDRRLWMNEGGDKPVVVVVGLTVVARAVVVRRGDFEEVVGVVVVGKLGGMGNSVAGTTTRTPPAAKTIDLFDYL